MNAEEDRRWSHYFNCKHKVKLTPEEAAQSLWNRPTDFGLDLYICTHCDHLHFGHNRQEKVRIVAERVQKRDKGKAIKTLGSACYYIKHSGRNNKEARAILNRCIAEISGNAAKQASIEPSKVSKTPIADMIDRQRYKKKA